MQTRTFDYKGFFVMYERQFHNGSLVFDARHECGIHTKEIYYGYTVKDAKRKFKEHLTQIKHKTPVHRLLNVTNSWGTV